MSLAESAVTPEAAAPLHASPRPATGRAQRWELRFESLFHPGRALVFPCDAAGRVELDSLPDRVRHNYLYARAVVGREYAMPAVVPVRL